MKRTTLILLVVLGLVLAAALGLALREFVGDTILMPILFIAWLAQLVFNSLPGWFWWAWFVIIAIIIAQRSLRVRPRDTERLRESRAPVIGPVQAWAERLRATRSRNVYFRWLVARDLADVSSELAEVLTLRHATQDEAPARDAQPQRRSDRPAGDCILLADGTRHAPLGTSQAAGQVHTPLACQAGTHPTGSRSREGRRVPGGATGGKV